ncbi:IQ motif [Trypanosoma melophagium]|uniref:IQ motif n=1 Tax=Trypanosoma melophagium TaxID=715481 RepID=UPI00351A448C|nr:IQ motif [Trypanosoma melophagium]
MSLSIVRRETNFDPQAPLTGKETQQDAERMEFQAFSLESSGKHMECLQLMEKALQIRCQLCTSGDSSPVSIGEACDAAERLVTKTNTYGVKAFKEDDYETASTLFGYALEMTGEESFPLREADDRRRYLRGVTLNNYGCMERRRGHFPDALAYMQRSMECTGEQSPVAFLNMSAVQTQLRLCEDAAESAMRALQNLGSSPEDPSLLAVAHHNLAMALEPLDPTRALEEYQEALNLARGFIGNESNTTLTIERNMMRFIQGRQRTRSIRGGVGESLPVRTGMGSVCSARGSLHYGETKPADSTPHAQRQPQAPSDNEDIFPHPFMNSAADAVVPRKVLVTRIYQPSISTRRSLLPPALPKRNKPAVGSTAGGSQMYTQIPRDRRESPALPPKDSRSAAASRLPPMESRTRHAPPPTVAASPMSGRSTNATQPSWGVQKPRPRAGAAAPQGIRGTTERSLPHVQQSSPLTHAATTKVRSRRTSSREGQPGRNSFFATEPASGSSRRLAPVGGLNVSHNKSPALLSGINTGSTGLVSSVPKHSKPIQAPTRSPEPLKTSRANLAAATSPASTTAATYSSNKNVKPVQSAQTRSTEPLKPSTGKLSTAAEAATTSPASTTAATSSSIKNVKRVHSAQTRSIEPMKPTTEKTTPSSERLKPVPTMGGKNDHSKPPYATIPSAGNKRLSVHSSTQLRARSTSPARPTATASNDSPQRGGLNRNSKSEPVEVPALDTSAPTVASRRQLKVSLGAQQGMNPVSYMSDRLDMLVVDEEELDRKQTSASIIQRAFRSYLARKLLSELREGRSIYNVLSEIREKIAVRKLQRWFRRSRHTGWHTHITRRGPAVPASERYKSAVRIQAAARGWMARRRYARRKYFERNSGHAALIVQSWWRQILAKRKLAALKKSHEEAKNAAVDKESREAAATIIQSRWRTRNAERMTRAERMRAKELRRKKAEARRLCAARTIQTWWRLLTARATLRQLREAQAAREARLKEHQRKVDAATKLQSFGRMIIAKKETEPLLTDFRINVARRIRERCTENQAASKIQRAFRCYYAKRLLKRLRREHREMKLRARRCALLAVAQRVGRGFLTRRDLGQYLQNLEREAREFNQRELALETADHVRDSIPTTEERKPDLFREEYRSAMMMEDKRSAPIMGPCLPVDDKQQSPKSPEKVELGLHNIEVKNQEQQETSRALQQEVNDEEERLSALAATVSAEEDADERQKPLGLHAEKERLNILNESERISALSTAVSMLEEQGRTSEEFKDHVSKEDQAGDVVDQEQQETSRALQQEVDDETRRLSILEGAVSAEEEADEAQRLDALRQEYNQVEEKLCMDQLSDGTLYTENHTSSEGTTESVPTEHISALTPSEAKGSESLEELLKIDREKRRTQMELEKRLRKARDALEAKANEYRQRKIATSENPEELKMLIPRPPLGRRRLQKVQEKELMESAESAIFSSAANAREQQQQQQQQQQRALDLTRTREKAALNITRLARGYLDRKYTRALKVIVEKYINHRLDVDSEEPPSFDHGLLQKFTDMYQSGVEKTRAIRLITLVQTFMRAAESRMIVSARVPPSWSCGKDRSRSTSCRCEAAQTLCSFARIIQAKKIRAALQKEVANRLQETQGLEALDTLRNFLHIIRAKRELAARSAAVCNQLEQEEALYDQELAATRISCFFRAVSAKNELRRRQEAIEQKLHGANAAEKIISFLRRCCAEQELARRRALMEQQRTVDIELERALDLAAMRVQRAYRSYKARQIAQMQRLAKKRRWGNIQAQDEEITAAMAAIAADAPNETEVWARLGFCAADVGSGSGSGSESERDLEVEALLYCVVQVQRVVRGWLARRRVEKLRLAVQQGRVEQEQQENAESVKTEKDC